MKQATTCELLPACPFDLHLTKVTQLENTPAWRILKQKVASMGVRESLSTENTETDRPTHLTISFYSSNHLPAHHLHPPTPFPTVFRSGKKNRLGGHSRPLLRVRRRPLLPTP